MTGTIDRVIIVIDDDGASPEIYHVSEAESQLFEPPFQPEQRKANSWQWHNLTQADFTRALYGRGFCKSQCISPPTKKSANKPGSNSNNAKHQSNHVVLGDVPTPPAPASKATDFITSQGSPISIIDLTADSEPVHGPMIQIRKSFHQKTSVSSKTVAHTGDSTLPLPAPNAGLLDRGASSEDAIDIDDLEILGEQNLLDSGLVLEPDLQILLRDVRTQSGISQLPSEKSFRQYPIRNASIRSPSERLDRYLYKNLDLMPSKTVELIGGDFLIIKDIIYESEAQGVLLRGYQVQRSKHLNGMLEKKLNETCLYLELDLDDARESYGQSVVEVPVSDVVKIRSLQCTNYEFPDCRNFSKVASRAEELEVYDHGGLTLRWKYTCSYANAVDRHDNVYKERSLEHIREDDILAAVKTSDAARRIKWRGQTVLGGSYVPRVPPRVQSSSMRISDGLHSTSCDEHSGSKHILGRKRTHSMHYADQEAKKCKNVGVECGPLATSTRRSSFIVLGDQNTHVIHDLTGNDSSDADVWQHHISTAKSSFISHAATQAIPCCINILTSDLSRPPPTGYMQPDIASSSFNRSSICSGQRFTYGDAFCGAGGTTRGASQAGLSVKWGFDSNPSACHSWRSNFPSSTCYELDSHAFVHAATFSSSNSSPIDVKVDVLHLSPPCQYFSPAHTCVGVNDEKNQAAMFAVQAVIGVAKPRVVTLEQTFGVCSVRHRWFFAALIHMFTTLRFSLRWSVVSLPQWGLPQRRNRLIIIAACPGELLPPIPAPTHSLTPNSSLPPPPTVHQTLSMIPVSSSSSQPDLLHNLDLVAFDPARYLPPWDAHKILPRAMTTSGGQNYHPSGKRDLTLREYACLQGFPLEHRFKGTGLKRQIGNAVPPVVAKVILDCIRKCLKEKDELELREGPME